MATLSVPSPTAPNPSRSGPGCGHKMRHFNAACLVGKCPPRLHGRRYRAFNDCQAVHGSSPVVRSPLVQFTYGANIQFCSGRVLVAVLCRSLLGR